MAWYEKNWEILSAAYPPELADSSGREREVIVETDEFLLDAFGITVDDVADVVDTVKEPEGLTYLGADEVVALHLYKEVGKNTIEATKERVLNSENITV